MPQKCHTIGCNEPAIAKGLCDKHRKRLERHGHTEPTRSEDWGKREKHPAYRSWCGLVRYHRLQIPTEWLNDFWSFVKAVPEKPSDAARAFRPRANEPWSSNNFYWKEPRTTVEKRKEKAAYMREWHSAVRKANPDYFKNQDLKKYYGVTLDWYKEQHAKQGGVCAICNQPETSVIRGKTLSLAVDHCHDTGKVRALLCAACNTGIGSLKHDRDLLQKAIAYLETYV
jgi:hypothetical protein